MLAGKRVLIVWIVMTAGMLPAVAQDEAENPPTLKLDRIMSSPAFIGQTRAPAAAVSNFNVETLIGGLSTPWALVFLPENEILLTEYASGQLRLLDADGRLSEPVSGLPAISRRKDGPGCLTWHSIRITRPIEEYTFRTQHHPGIRNHPTYRA